MRQSQSKNYRACVILYLVISGICLFLVLGCGTFLYVVSRQDDTPTEINWDVSTGNSIDLVNWPENHSSSVYHIEYPIVNLKISDDYEIASWRPRHIYVYTQDHVTINNIAMTVTKTSPKAAYDEVIWLAALFDIDTTKADRWYQEVQVQEYHIQPSVLLLTDSHDPQISIEAMLTNDDRVYISVSIYGLTPTEVQ